MDDMHVHVNRDEEALPKKSGWKHLERNQKVSLVTMLFLLVSLPVGILFTLNPIQFLFSRGAGLPVTPPTTPPDTATPTDIILPTTEPTSTPELTMTPTPTLVPTVTVASPTVFSTSTPIPTVTPIKNTPPQFMTSSVKVGRRGYAYSTEVVAQDRDGDTLSMTFTNLPAGLRLTGCTNRLLGKTYELRCRIEGTPTRAGVFTSSATVRDSKNASSTQSLYFWILPSFR